MARSTRTQIKNLIEADQNQGNASLRLLAQMLLSGMNLDDTTFALRVANPDDSTIGVVGGGGPISASAGTILTPGQFNLAIANVGSPTTLTIPATATFAVITCDPLAPAGIRWTWETTDPTGTIGHYLAPGDTYEFDNIAVLKLFADAGTAGVKAHVSYRKYP